LCLSSFEAFLEGISLHLSLHPSNEFLVRCGRDDPVKLGAIVVDQADVFNHNVINFPFLVAKTAGSPHSSVLFYFAGAPLFLL